MNNDNLNENLSPDIPEEENVPVTPTEAEETAPVAVEEEIPEEGSPITPSEPEATEAPEAAEEPEITESPEAVEEPEIPAEAPAQPAAGYYPPQAPVPPVQQPYYPYGQPAPAQPPRYYQNAPYSANPYPAYPQQPQYRPYPQYSQQPYQQPPQVKTRMKAGTVVLIVCMSILTVLGFGAFGLAVALYGNQTVTPQEPSLNYEDFYGDFFKDFEEFTPPESSTPDEGYTIKEPEQPKIDIPDVSEGIVINGRPSTPELSAEDVYSKVIPSTVTVDVDVYYTNGEQEDSTGTGIFISEDGFCITNSHVVANSKSVSVKVITSDGTEYPAVVVGLDKTTDLAVLKVDGKGFTPAEFGSSDELNIGEWVIAIGNPGGTEFTGSLTRGVISGLDRKVGSYSANGMTYLQTDAAINPGNSGGPLVNMHGQVIGINSSKIVADYYEGMGFAIPSSKAKDIIDQLLEKGYVQGRVRLGITGQNVLYGTPQGVTIIAIDEYSSFAGTEAKVGDVITAVNDVSITGLTDLANEFLKYAPGDTVKVSLYRSSTGETLTIDVVLLEDKGETQR